MTKKPEDFKILTAREHVRQRIGMYMGSASLESIERFVLGKWQTVEYVPALVKMIDEIIDNSVDEAIRTNFKFANKIDVSVSENEITVTDNGRGIPQDKILDNTTKTEILRPVAAWTRTNAGTSFTDDRVTIGTNGVGSAATNFLSTKFHGETWSDGKGVAVICEDGGLSTDVKTFKRQGSGTSVKFTPDFSCFETSELNEIYVNLIRDRLSSLQMAFPSIKFTMNRKSVVYPSMRDYAKMYGDDKKLIFEKNNMSMFLGTSEDGLRTNSYINGVNTRSGGAYVDFIIGTLADELVRLIKKKHKIDVNKATIRNGFTFVLFAKNFSNPKFDSQTKERLTNTYGEVKAHYEESLGPDILSVAKKVMATEELIDPIIEAQLAKKRAADARAAKAAQKKLKKVKVAKHVSANSEDSTLLLVEGDSAMGFLLAVRNPDKIGAYPLRGVVMNVWDMQPADVLKNKELSELIAILGLDINKPNSVDDMSYKEIGILTDADHDGSHIAVLLICFFAKFWPKIFEQGKIKIFRTPIMISTKNDKTKWLYSYDDAHVFKDTHRDWKNRYIKGLGLLTEEEYNSVINDPVYDVISLDDIDSLEMMAGKDSNLRKKFMMA